MKDEIVSFEVAKLAKEKGYSVGSDSNYTLYKKKYVYDGDPNHPESYKKGEVRYHDRWYFQNGETPFDKPSASYEVFEAPTQSLLQRWLRETHKIYAMVYIMEDSEGIVYYEFGLKQIINWLSDKGCKPMKFKSYEDALEQCLFEGLKLI